MENENPPSPAPFQHDGDLHSGFQHLVHYNNAQGTTLYPQEQIPIDTHSQFASPHSRYASPVPQQMMAYDHGTPMTQHQFGGSPYSRYQQEYSAYPEIPTQSTPRPYSTPATSPPTPLSTGITTRSGRIARPGDSPSDALGPRSSRVEKPKARSRPKKKKNGRPDSERCELEAPLSELCKDITEVTDTNIEEYVNRSLETRRNEVANSKDKKVKRPMNAFMLYRKAFQNRVKKWRSHDNHQIVSKVCGASWPMEPPELQNQFSEWAKIERENHARAFPDYKFTPAKTKAKRKGVDSDDDGDLSNDDIHTINWGVPLGRRMHSRDGPDADYRPGRSTPYQGFHGGIHQNRMMQQPVAMTASEASNHASNYYNANPYKNPPAQYHAQLGNNQYYQQRIEVSHQGARGHPMHYSVAPQGSRVEDVLFTKTQSPVMYHGSPADEGYNLYPPPPPQPPLQQHFSQHQPLDVDYLTGAGGDDFSNALGLYDQNNFPYTDRDQHSYTPDLGVGDGGQPPFDPSQFDDPLGMHESAVDPQLESMLKGEDWNKGDEWNITAVDGADDVDRILGTDTPEG